VKKPHNEDKTDVGKMEKWNIWLKKPSSAINFCRRRLINEKLYYF